MNQMGVVCGSFLGPIVETNATAVESSSGASSVGIPTDIGGRVATPAPEDCDAGARPVQVDGADIRVDVPGQTLTPSEDRVVAEVARKATARVARWLDDLPVRWGGARMLVVGQVATRWAPDHYLDGEPLETPVAEEFAWQEGWEYRLPTLRPGVGCE
jgi:hypothetical protein